MLISVSTPVSACQGLEGLHRSCVRRALLFGPGSLLSVGVGLFFVHAVALLMVAASHEVAKRDQLPVKIAGSVVFAADLYVLQCRAPPVLGLFL